MNAFLYAFFEYAEAMWHGLVVAILIAKILQNSKEAEQSKTFFEAIMSISAVGILTYMCIKFIFYFGV